jgi:hypothetical protein
MVVPLVTFCVGRSEGIDRTTTRLRDLSGALRSLAGSAVLNRALALRRRAAGLAGVAAGIVCSAPPR